MARKTRANAAHTDENRLRILEAAAIAFMESGFDAATVDDIAGRLNSTKGRLYYSFPSKTSLLIAVMEEGMSRTLRAVMEAKNASDDALDKLYAMAYAHALQVIESLPFHVVTQDMLNRHRRRSLTEIERQAIGKIIQQRHDYEAMFSSHIADAVAAGQLRQIEPVLATRTMFGTLNSTAQWYRPQADKAHSHANNLAETVTSVAMRGLIS
ncbi:TetR family transcriptional regulator [Paracoccus sp. SCSIO 75233]|uniref:TetR family transcriptional regulator n=1 Tax=Paracoccus sp. SCSIO 75233 TaxID=3017782 RepID=UPI0022F09D0E|nr:TetR family transcriptional regulator [Paracoccus sp. SCSIO 75233]WBU52992.1 TetR family transcriptional regulator [Paracoccus sp. SCSIO 75233]